MLSQTPKIKELLIISSSLVACLVFALVVLVPTTALAKAPSIPKKETYALGCKPNPGPANADAKGKLSCNANAPNETAYIVDTGDAASAMEHDTSVTVVTVDCGKSTLAKTYKKGQSVSSIDCKDKKSPKVTQLTNNNPPTCDSANNCSDPAANPKANCSNTGCDLIVKYIDPLVNLLSVVFGLIAVISIIAGSIQYSASTGDPAKSSAAKSRIQNTIIAIVAYFFLYAFLQFLIPGGLFK